MTHPESARKKNTRNSTTTHSMHWDLRKEMELKLRIKYSVHKITLNSKYLHKSSAWKTEKLSLVWYWW